MPRIFVKPLSCATCFSRRPIDAVKRRKSRAISHAPPAAWLPGESRIDAIARLLVDALRGAT